MPKFEGYELPDEIIRAFEAGIDDISDEILLLYAKTHPDLFRGFRIKKNNAEAFRKQILTRLRCADALDRDLLNILAMGGLTLPLVDVLCPDFLERMLPNFLRVFGAAEFLAAMLGDARPYVRMMAIDYLEVTDNLKKQELPDLETACAMCREWFLPLAAVTMGALHGPEHESVVNGPSREAAPPLESPEKARALQERIDNLERELKTIERQGRKEKQKLTLRLEKLQKENQRIQQDAAKEKSAAAEARDAAAEAKRAADALRSEFETRLTSRTEQALSAHVRRWLARPETLDDEVRRLETDENKDVLVVADEALARQEQSDRHYGNRVTLQLRLDQLVAAREKLDRARRESLHPLAELRAAAEKLDHEIEHLRLRLKEASPVKPVVERLLAHINEAENAQALEERYALVNELADAGALDPMDMRRMYEKYYGAMGRLYDAYAPKIVRGPQPRDPMWRLRVALDADDPVLLFLDGHNILFNLPDIFDEVCENGVPGAKARQRLVGIMTEMVRGAPHIQARVYFDGPTYAERKHGDNVHEVYSGGGDTDQRADRAIVGHLEYCCREYSAMSRLVVTDDRELSARAKELGADYVRLQQFGTLLEEFLARPKA